VPCSVVPDTSVFHRAADIGHDASRFLIPLVEGKPSDFSLTPVFQRLIERVRTTLEIIAESVLTFGCLLSGLWGRRDSLLTGGRFPSDRLNWRALLLLFLGLDRPSCVHACDLQVGTSGTSNEGLTSGFCWTELTVETGRSSFELWTSK